MRSYIDPLKVVLSIWFVILLSAVVLIKYFAPYIPDYDGLEYLSVAKTMSNWFFETGDYKLIINKEGNDFVFFWPITNALSVLIASVIFYIIDVNIIPLFVNSVYLLAFILYVSKIKSQTYAMIAMLVLCGHTLFFRLFTTFTSEFGVGLWIFSFLLTLVLNSNKKGVCLFVLTIVGLFLRTIDIVFILASTLTYSLISIFALKENKTARQALKYVGLGLILSSPFFYKHYLVAYNYVYNVSFGASSETWKSMGGVSNRLDVFLKYGEFLYIYNSWLIFFGIFLILISAYCKLLFNRFFVLVIAVSLSICFPLLLASSLNIQVAFWIYSACVFVICELGWNLYLFSKGKNIIFSSNRTNAGILVIIFTCWILFFMRSWGYEVSYLRQQKDISNISFKISEVLNLEKNSSVLAFNYHGVGALDAKGLSLFGRKSFIYGGVSDIYSKNMNPELYLNFDQKTNFFIAAHENYFFAHHFGINDYVKEIYQIFLNKYSNLGFKKIQEISDKGRIFDIWYRPTANVYLQYKNFNDNWIGISLPIDVGSPNLCDQTTVSGLLKFSLNFQNPNLTKFSPPFLVSLNDLKSGNKISSVTIDKFGLVDFSMKITNASCGKYELSIDKTFSTILDSRRLSAEFVRFDSFLRFDRNP